MFKKDGPFNLPEIEQKVLRFWGADNTFEKSLAKTKKGKRFVFFEGPPTANGRPGIHHVLTRAFKDIILRYQTMRGRYVERKAGWDTHGLPVEIEVEKQLGLNSKPEIEKYGIAKFNEKARESVWQYKTEWEKLTERVGFWIDFKDPYVTYETKYIESLWWVIKQVYERGFLYEGYRVAPWCSRCGTALSSHELAQGYKKVHDTSLYAKFKLKAGQKIGKTSTTNENTFILSWTTTPWTLPGNVALAVGEKVNYTVLKNLATNEIQIVASDLVKKVYKDIDVKVMNDKILGRELVGLEYEPLFDIESLQNEKSHRIYSADFVTTTDGTGIVHTAVMYGEDDYQLGVKVGLPRHHTVTETGKFTDEVMGLAGLSVKSSETEQKIIAMLQGNNQLFKKEVYEHDYPFCWRCSTRLLYYARSSWFIAMSKLKKELLATNKKINWLPAHVKDGRFGNWLEEVKDWNFSRERYWGTPLPIWQCQSCDFNEVIGSLDELKKRAVNKNEFFFVRHGEAAHNIKKLCGTHKDTKNFTSRLTVKGKADVKRVAAKLKKSRIDIIISSPLMRAKETSAIIAKATGAKVIYENQLIDVNVGTEFFLKPFAGYFKLFAKPIDYFTQIPAGGESWSQVKERMVKVLYKINERYRGKRILIVSHGHPLWLLRGALYDSANEKILKMIYPKTGALYPVTAKLLPRDQDGKIDLHRPGIDMVQIKCQKCDQAMTRVKALIDVWFDSGAMPVAQWHYPFENKAKVESHVSRGKKVSPEAYPADYIVEAVDQTRGWFYTLLATAVLLKKPAPYKNVLVLGHILDKDGLKMSKSKGNVVDPWHAADTYGADAIRWHFFSVSDPGEPTRFSEEVLKKVSRRLFALIFNSFSFLKLNSEYERPQRNLLDDWISARLAETNQAVTASLDAFNVFKAARAIEEFVDDLSRWYIRRSRKDPSVKTLQLVLTELAKIMAPFTPFFAEALYQSVTGNNQSVHLADWPKLSKPKINRALLSDMAEVRRLASLTLAERDAKGLKVRQPLAELKIKSEVLADRAELIEILKDEVNVKRVFFDKKLKSDVELDTAITAELKAEGTVRELTRLIQGMRRDAGLAAADKIILVIKEATPEVKKLIELFDQSIQEAVNAKQIVFRTQEKTTVSVSKQIDGQPVKIGLRKI